MSKSKGNVVSPEPIIERFGADTMRLYILFAGPPERDAEWRDDSIEGCNRFLNRIFRHFETHESILGAPVGESIGLDGLSQAEKRLLRKTHWAILKVQKDLEGTFHFNTAIAAAMELSNEMSAFAGDEPIEPGTAAAAVCAFAFNVLIRLLAPMTPHICEELWERTGHRGSIFAQAMPQANPEYARQETITLVIQINSKIRAREDVEAGKSDAELEDIALSNPRIQELLAGKALQKVLIIQGKLVNLIVK
jgi:leucyl-tRNA synthetase